ncbi:hypothetical protein CLU96_3506 [Chryseobacterium sp. 52]|nr:hypothetical protein CLU96_3506 [Chryseobacterium sp. 52]
MFLVLSGLIFCILILRFSILRSFVIEITEHIIVIKYYHPVLPRHYTPVLEMPITEINNFQLDRLMAMNFFKIVISKRNKYRIFCYRLDRISKDQLIILQREINSVLSNHNKKAYL